MVRKAVCALFALMILVGGLWAIEIKGKLKKVDGDRITVTVGSKDYTYRVSKNVKVTIQAGPKARTKDVEGGVNGLKEGDPVTMLTERQRDLTELVTIIVVDGNQKGGEPKDDKDKKDK